MVFTRERVALINDYRSVIECAAECSRATESASEHIENLTTLLRFSAIQKKLAKVSVNILTGGSLPDDSFMPILEKEGITNFSDIYQLVLNQSGTTPVFQWDSLLALHGIGTKQCEYILRAAEGLRVRMEKRVPLNSILPTVNEDVVEFSIEAKEKQQELLLWAYRYITINSDVKELEHLLVHYSAPILSRLAALDETVPFTSWLISTKEERRNGEEAYNHLISEEHIQAVENMKTKAGAIISVFNQKGIDVAQTDFASRQEQYIKVIEKLAYPKPQAWIKS